MKVNTLRNSKKDKIHEKLKILDNKGITVLLLRHSIREEILDARISKDIPLTDKGRELAIEYGIKLPKDRFLRIFHSPSPRCRETADLILKGFAEGGGQGVSEGEFSYLGSPFMLKPNLALGIVNELGGPGFIREWFAGKIDDSIMEPSDQAVNKMMNYIKSNVKPERTGEVQILITHDFTITLMIGLLIDLANEEFKWPGYLDGVLMNFKDEEVWVYYIGFENTYNVSDFEGKGYGI